MKLPLPTQRNKLGAHLREIRRELRSLRPSRSPGVLTTHGTAGVQRRAVAGSGGRGRGGAARWA